MKVYNKKEVNFAMLLQFRFSNFRSFAEETVFDMTATTIKEHKYSLINKNGVNILPIGALYGSNASGKSSFFMAFKNMQDVILNRLMSTMSTRHHINDLNFSEPFFFYESQNPTNYEVSLLIGLNKYRYGFECINNQITNEYLYKQKISKNKTNENLIFQRSYGDKTKKRNINFGKNISKSMYNEIQYCYSMSTNKTLLLSDIGLRAEEEELCNVFEWFLNSEVFLSNSQDNLSRGEVVERILGNYLVNENYQNNVKKLKTFISDFDPSISDIILGEKIDNDGKKYAVAMARHIVNNKKYDIPLTMESEGTNKAMFIAFTVIQALEFGSPIFFDELDSKLHPLLLRRIIQMFTDRESNPNGAQLIFSAHNIINLDSSDLRRDEIWFVEKENHMSTMYSLVEFDDDGNSIRSDLNFGKHYLSGRFGAIPFQD